jgi:hypothetical protein
MKLTTSDKLYIVISLDTSCYMEKDSKIQDSKGNFLSKDEVSRNFIDKLISSLYISAKGNDIVEVAVIPYLKNKLQLVLPAGEFQNKKKISEISKKSQQTIEKVVNGQIVYEKSNSNSWFEFGLSGADYIVSGLKKVEPLFLIFIFLTQIQLNFFQMMSII